MAVLMDKEADKNEALSARINADLKAKMEETSSGAGSSDAKDPDLVEDADYVKDFEKTGRFAWVWLVVILAVVIVGVVIWQVNRG